MTAADIIEARRAYLRGLAWDGVLRVKHFAGSILRAPSRRATERAAGFFLDAVARAFTPGHPVGPVLTLCGPQGTGKSSVLQCLAGDGYADATARYMLRPSGAWIVEAQDMEVMSESERKHFFTATSDTFRAKGAKLPTTEPRSYVLACTTNDAAWTRGARSVSVIRVTERANVALLTTQRDQLWAEAVALHVKNGGAA